ncbi:MAG TPA: hypothetical protein VFL59_03810, partial [Candidatus Nanopelagicales bacterium]|nr:hypothetical protein [Candidatus Nanopelagicales bacterium]
MTSPATWRSRAVEAWRSLDAAGIRPTRSGLAVREPGRRRREPLWPFSQVLHATVAVAPYDAAARDRLPGLWSALEDYRRGEGYAERPRMRTRYYDDDAWVALAALDAGDRALAARVLEFLRTGVRDGGGVLWVEGGATLNACSTGATGLVAARLHGPDDPVAHGAADFLLRLRDGDGLVADHVRADGSVDGRVFAYNQGLLVALLHAVGRTDEALDHARRTAAAFDRDRLWSHPAVFVGILLREVVVLLRDRPDTDLSAYVDDYLDRVWHESRTASGLLVGGGIGRYDSGTLLDHAGLVTALAALA